MAKQAQPKIDIREIVGLHVQRLRTESDLTQLALADNCQIYRTYLSRIENGAANPTLTVLAALAEVLDVNVAQLLNE
jgi:transcriptional regulator with XRE-family HTH domain